MKICLSDVVKFLDNIFFYNFQEYFVVVVIKKNGKDADTIFPKPAEGRSY